MSKTNDDKEDQCGIRNSLRMTVKVRIIFTITSPSIQGCTSLLNFNQGRVYKYYIIRTGIPVTAQERSKISFKLMYILICILIS